MWLKCFYILCEFQYYLSNNTIHTKLRKYDIPLRREQAEKEKKTLFHISIIVISQRSAFHQT